MHNAIFNIEIIILCYSSLLFLIVALEGAQAKVTSFYLEENDTYSMTYDNITLNYDNYENFESSTTLNTETESLASFNTNEKHLVRQFVQLNFCCKISNYLFIFHSYICIIYVRFIIYYILYSILNIYKP